MYNMIQPREPLVGCKVSHSGPWINCKGSSSDDTGTSKALTRSLESFYICNNGLPLILHVVLKHAIPK